ncbi:MAG: hypothetical protein HY308_03650 [Gammaproteobacteria bacterium]|nr:hypothetical protein [Gammaproteobacteria bacterium]
MRFAFFTVILLLSLGCQPRDNRYPEDQFPEDQHVVGPFNITSEWQTITFSKPLAINREGSQSFNFVVDRDRYVPNSEYQIEDIPNQANLRRRDGVLVKPEVVLIGDNGQEVLVTAVSNTWLNVGGLTIGFSMLINPDTPSPPFPEAISAFRAVRVRSNEPFTANYLWWWVDGHPDYPRCGYRRCAWWQRIFWSVAGEQKEGQK